jgi:hypothetical protein
MSQSLRGFPVVAAGWPDLVDELDRWYEAGRVATLWWRDDDAVAPSRALERVASIAGKVSIALAVIPAAAQPELAGWLSHRKRSGPGRQIAVLQHGWRHSNHSVGAKKSEFPQERSSADVAYELAAGRARLAELFDTSALPILVPPWNRFDGHFLPFLGHCGLSGISKAEPRRTPQPLPGVVEANIHVDLVAWMTGRRDFIGEEVALGSIISHLRARRLGLACANEPTGILTHHLVQDKSTDTFLHRLLDVTGAHVAALWLEAAEIFGPVPLVPG